MNSTASCYCFRFVIAATFGLLLSIFPCSLLPAQDFPLPSLTPAEGSQERRPSLGDIDKEEGGEIMGRAIKPATGEGQYLLGELLLDNVNREIRFPGRVNMESGLIEVVVATEQGKLHESIVATSIHPLDLHLAMLLLGLKDGRNPEWFIPEDKWNKPVKWNKPPGDRVQVFVSWQKNGEKEEYRAEQLLQDNRSGESIPETDWVFVGSYLDSEGFYMAEEVGSLVTNYHDQSTVIDLPLELGQVDDYTYAFEDRIPPVGTPVEVRVLSVGE